MKPDMSHDLVKDLTVKTAENNCTVASTSLSRALKIGPKIDRWSAVCSHRITPITTANCNRGNLAMLRTGAKISLIIRRALPEWLNRTRRQQAHSCHRGGGSPVLCPHERDGDPSPAHCTTGTHSVR